LTAGDSGRTSAAVCSVLGVVLMALGAAGTFGDPVHGSGRYALLSGAVLAIIGGTVFARSGPE
jgi:hypothetical protein